MAVRNSRNALTETLAYIKYLFINSFKAGGAADDGTKLTKKNTYLTPGGEPQKDASNPKVRVKSATSMKVYEPSVVKGFDDVEAGKTEGVANEHGAAKKKKKIKIRSKKKKMIKSSLYSNSYADSVHHICVIRRRSK